LPDLVFATIIDFSPRLLSPDSTFLRAIRLVNSARHGEPDLTHGVSKHVETDRPAKTGRSGALRRQSISAPARPHRRYRHPSPLRHL